jgi:1-acyl-sn-glycerol-3-phosphate acyltransferase
VILAANHTSVLDGPLLYAASRRPVHALVKQEMFAGALSWALRTIGQIPVNRFAVDPAAVKACLSVLHRGDVVAIYPEGHRGRGDFGQVKPGVAYLAMCTGAPIIPVVGLGLRAAGQSVGSLPRLRSTIDVVFGPRIDVDPVAWPRRQQVVREQTQQIATALRSHVDYACDLTGQSLPETRTSTS